MTDVPPPPPQTPAPVSAAPVPATESPSPHKRQRGLLIALFVIGVLVALGLATMSIIQKQAGEVASKKSLYTGPVEKIRIGNIGEYSIFNLIARDKGYFKEHGLDATIKEYPAGPPAVAALLKGEVDVAVAADFVGVSNIFQSPNIRMLAKVSEQETFHVVSRSASGITNPTDLKGKKVGVTKKGAGEFFLGRFLILNNLALTDVTIVDLPPPKLVEGIISGELDSIVIFEPHVYNLKKKLASAVVIWKAQGDEKTEAVAYTTDEYIKAHPDVIERYLRSLVAAERYLNQDPKGAQQILLKSAKYEEGYVAYIWNKLNFVIQLDQELLLTMEDQARWIIENKLTDKTSVPNYLKYIFFDGLEVVKPEAITIIR